MREPRGVCIIASCYVLPADRFLGTERKRERNEGIGNRKEKKDKKKRRAPAMAVQWRSEDLSTEKKESIQRRNQPGVDVPRYHFVTPRTPIEIKAHYAPKSPK